MAYIYQITNDINGKIYIGKTEFSIEKRFQEHCRDSKKEYRKDRPLYRAMNKYGIEHFHIELIEETDNPEEREKYWIEIKGSFKNGYNATMGGGGRRYIDYDLVISTYNELQNISKTAKALGIDISSVSDILKVKKVKTLSAKEVSAKVNSIIVNQYDLQGNFICSYPSMMAAAREIGDPNGSGHISEACRGKRQSAYGFKWKIANNI